MNIISIPSQQIFFVVTIILFQNISKCASNTKSYENILNPLHSIASANIRNGFLHKSSNISRENNVFNTSKAKKFRVKKWQVGRVSRKHYEIINMLWRKTKMPFDSEVNNEINHSRQNGSSKNVNSLSHNEMSTFLPSPILPASTPSFIEFYYLDESYDTKNSTFAKHVNLNVKEETPIKKLEKLEFALLNPVLTFHVNNPYYKRSTINTKYRTNRIHQRIAKTIKSPTSYFTYISFTQPYKSFLKEKFENEGTVKADNNFKEKVVSYMTLKPLKNTKVITEKTINTETCPYTTEVLTTLNKNMSLSSHVIQVSTAYDRIKFFEMYDKNTYEPNYHNRKSLKTNDIELIPYENEHGDKKVLLEHVDQNMGHDHDISHKMKHAKKHIVENNREIQGQYNVIDKKSQIKRVIFKTKNGTTITIKEATTGTVPDMKLKLIHQNISNPATWSEYPFVAVYIYEPLQVHCDAAAISQHWLITAGSCLSRHHKKPGGTGRSAFVTYCGDTWWSPERVAYVKYSVVHPRYHSREKLRRYLYNIGLIQVVTSMGSACAGWAPIPLMSHKLVPGEEESIAIAVGWGLDRFDVRYSSTNLRKLPLSLYENRLYSESCPGNSEYSKSKRLEDDSGMRNVYCLALPPYLTEDNDPVHGSLLLVGGKLIALYLQEERRPWGEQCAQYTGTWRLIPWVMDVAHEPDETDSFTDF